MKTGMVVGTASPQAWCQVSISSAPERQVIIILSLAYLGESELIDLAAIGGSLLEGMRLTGKLTKEELEGVSTEIKVSAVLLTRQDKELKVSGIGGMSVYMLRQNKMGRIFQGGNVIQSMEGQLSDGDTLLAATKAIEDKFPVAELHQIMAGGVGASENLAVMVHGRVDSSDMAAVIGEVEIIEKADDASIPPGAKFAPITKLSGLTDKLANIGRRIRVTRPLFISPEKKSRNLWIGSVLILLLLIGVGSGMVRRSQLSKARAFDQLNSSVTQKIGEAKSVGDLNPERAKLLLKQSSDEIDIYTQETEEAAYLVKVQELREKILETETEVFKKQEVAVTTLVELAVLEKNMSAEKLFIDEDGNILLPDTGANRIRGINAQDKSNFEMNTDSVGILRELGLSAKKIYGIANSGIALITQKESRIVIEPDELWKEITLLDAFAGNIYLLDKGQSDIWKYPALTDGFGSRRRWLAAGIEPDLTNVIDMKVDGDVWILTSTGKLERYSRGVPVTFSMEGFPLQEGENFVDPVALFISEGEVFVLERGSKRVVVFEGESGKYKRQYSAEILGEGQDMVVWEDRGYVLLQDKIVWFQL